MIQQHVAKYCPRVKPYFYKVEKTGKTSYFLGTRHMSVRLAMLPKSIPDKLRTARVVVFENAEGRKRPLPQPSGRLSEQLGGELWERYRSLVGDRIAAKLDERSVLEAIVILEMLYEDRDAGLDDELAKLARSTNRRIEGLDTDEQDTNIGKLFDIAALRKLLEDVPTRAALAERAGKSLAKYCEGSDVVKPTDAADADQQQFEDVALHARNRAWVEKLAPMLGEGDAFVAVGAAHLRGPRNVLELLRDNGFTVTRVAE